MEVIMMIGIESDAQNLINRLHRSGYRDVDSDVAKCLAMLCMATAESVSEDTGDPVSWTVLLPSDIDRVTGDTAYDTLYALELSVHKVWEVHLSVTHDEIHQSVMHDLVMCKSADWNWHTLSEVITGDDE